MPYAAGTGTYANPYQIANLDDLNGIRDYPGAHFIVTADIDASPTATWNSGDGWIPIPDFTGTVRGQGRVVNGLHINRPSADYVGLFATINKTNATYPTAIRDLHLINANITGQHYVGALCGQLTTTLYGEPNPRLLYNCSAEGSVSGVNYTGGLVGYAKGPANAGHAPDPDIWYYSVNDDLIGMMEACVTDIVLTATGQASGGLIGFVDELNIYKCYTNGPVNGFALVGGLIGDTNRAYIERCYSLGAVTGQIVTGGIVGRARFLSEIRNSYSLGDVTGTSTNPRTGEVQSSQDATGGVAGELRGGNGANFVRCYSFGSVSGGHRVGGLIGAAYGWTARMTYVNQGYARGDVTGIDYVGGLIGYADMLQWYESYCTGAVVGQGANTGAVLGGIGPSGKNEIEIWVPVYYNSDINRASSVNGGTGKSTAQLKNGEDFEWPQFDRSWIHDPADYENDGYPQLKIFYDPLGVGLAAIRGGKSDTQDQGLVLSYTLAGMVYQRALKSGTWGYQQEVAGLQTPVKTLNLFRTKDHRLGYITDKDGRLSLAVTAPYGTAIQYTKELTDGTNGSLIERDDKLEFYYITTALTIGKISADFSGDWSDITFGVQEPLTSDSYITKLKGKLFDYLYLVWQASGQHRLLKAKEIAEKAEPLALVEGSITIRDDSPVISASFEFDSFDRLDNTIICPNLQWIRNFNTNKGETTHLVTIPDGYTPVYTEEDLTNIRNNPPEGNYIQMADITITVPSIPQDGIVTSPNAAEWIKRKSNLPVGSNIVDIAYGNGKYIACTEDGRACISSNGTSWTVVHTGIEGGIFSIAYGNGLWVVAGKWSRIATSLDGTNWTIRDSLYDINKVAYGNGLWVAVGSSGRLITSEDGIEWTPRTSQFGSSHIYGVTYDGVNEIWRIAGTDGKMATSTDGISWTMVQTAISSISRVAYGNGLWIMAGEDGKIAISTDKYTWTTLMDIGFGEGNTVRGVAYGNGLWVAVGYNGKMATSTDGITWTLGSSGFGTSFIYDVAYEDGLWVIAGGGGKLATSTDGILWTLQDSAIGSSYTIFDVAYDNGLWVVVGGGGKIATSADGITWTARNSGIFNTLYGVTCANGHWVAVGNSGKIITSTDGTTWSLLNSGTTYTLYGIAYGSGYCVAVGASGRIVTSADRTTWVTTTFSGTFGSNPINTIAFDGSRFIIGGGGSRYGLNLGAYQDIGYFYEWQINSTQQTFKSIAYGNGLWIATTNYSEKLFISADGKSWAYSDGLNIGYVNNVAYASGKYVAVGESGLITTSTDGKNWGNVKKIATKLKTAIYADNQWIAVGYVAPPTGWESMYFGGIYDGNGYTINGLNKPLFDYFDGEVRNLILRSIDIIDIDCGGVCDYNNGIINNCYVTGTIVAGIDSSAGGICQYNEGTISNCGSLCTIMSDGDHAGGICGYSSGEINNSFATGSISGSASNLGGLVGYLNGNAINCYAIGDVQGLNIDGSVGGFAGFIDSYHVEECFATGDVNGYGAGGFAGTGWSAELTNCYAHGNVNGDNYAGGFLGMGDLRLINCYSIGRVAGINTGGLIGRYYGDAITNCYYNSEISGQSDTDYGEPKPTALMAVQTTYTNWDFASVWFIDNSENTPDHTPASKIKISFRAGDSEPFTLGEYYVDRTNYTVGDENVSVEARNVIGKYLKDQTFDEQNKYMPQALKTLFEQVLTGAGITKFHVAENPQSVGIEFAPNDAILDGIDELLKLAPGWQIREESEGLVVIAPRNDPLFTQPATYTFYRNRDIFSRSVTKDDGQTYGRVCVHDPDMQTRVYRPVASSLGWLPPAQKTYYVEVPAGTTSVDAAKYATELAEQMSNSGEVETFVGPIRPHLQPGDEAVIMDDAGPRKVGIITTVKHGFGRRGFYTEFTVDSGGKIGRPRLGDFINEMAAKFNKIKSKRIY